MDLRLIPVGGIKYEKDTQRCTNYDTGRYWAAVTFTDLVRILIPCAGCVIGDEEMEKFIIRMAQEERAYSLVKDLSPDPEETTKFYNIALGRDVP